MQPGRTSDGSTTDEKSHGLEQPGLREQLRGREIQFRRIIETARDAIISIDISGNIIDWNRAAEEMFQYSPSEIEGTPVTRIMPEPYRETHRLALQRVAREGVLHDAGKTIELEGLRKDGTKFPLELSLSTWQMDGSLFFTGFLRDITKRKQAEQSLQESERYRRLLFEQSPIGLALCRMNGDLVDCNPAYARIVGHTREELRQLSYWDLTPEEYAQEEERQLASLRARGCYGPYEKEYIHKNGHRVPVRLRGLLLNKGGESLIWSSTEDISETHAAQRALRESQSVFSLFMDHLPAAVFIKAAYGRVFFVNKYMKRHLCTAGMQSASASADSLAKVVERLSRDDRMVLAEGWCEIVEKLKDNSGQERTFRIHNFAIPRPEEEETLIGGIAWDITDAVAASEALERSERRYREIFETAEEGIWLVDAEANTEEVNHRMAQMLGYTIDEMQGRHLFDFMDEEACKKVETNLDRHRRGTAEKHDFRLRTKSGADLWTIMGTAPMYSSQGVYIGALRMVTDITERKLSEAAIKQERDFAEGLIETAPFIVLVLDPQGNILRFNSFMEKLSGYALEEVKGCSWFETFLAKRDIPEITDISAEANGGLPTGSNVNAIVTREGQKRLIAWHNTTLRDAAGELEAELAIGLDLTEQKAKEAQLIQAQKMEMVGQLTGGIAHDFNNLLTVVLGNLNLLAKSIGPDCDPEVFEMLNDSLSAANDGAELTRRLLAFSRTKPLQQKRVDISAFLQNFQRFLRRTIGPDMAVQTDVEEQLDYLLCDQPQLESAMLNLALNARDAMPEGGHLFLRAAAKQAAELDLTLKPGTYVELSVADTGEGMDADQLARAIEPFYTTKGSKQGSGLGLSMVFGFCQHAGGRFLLASAPGAGTRARIILPLNGHADAEVTQAPESLVQDFTWKGTALVVEDEARVRKLAARYLKELGYQVQLAENGDAAIEALQADSPIDLVFSDIVMPGEIQGDDLYRWAKEQRPEVKVLLTTGLQSTELVELAKDGEGSMPIPLPKPYTKDQLAAAIRDASIT